MQGAPINLAAILEAGQGIPKSPSGPQGRQGTEPVVAESNAAGAPRAFKDVYSAAEDAQDKDHKSSKEPAVDPEVLATMICPELQTQTPASLAAELPVSAASTSLPTLPMTEVLSAAMPAAQSSPQAAQDVIEKLQVVKSALPDATQQVPADSSQQSAAQAQTANPFLAGAQKASLFSSEKAAAASVAAQAAQAAQDNSSPQSAAAEPSEADSLYAQVGRISLANVATAPVNLPSNKPAKAPEASGAAYESTKAVPVASVLAGSMMMGSPAARKLSIAVGQAMSVEQYKVKNFSSTDVLSIAHAPAQNVSSASSAGVVAPASAAPSGDMPAQIAKAVQENQPPLGQQMVLTLNPPELGRVRLTLEAHGDQIRGVLKVDDPKTLMQLRNEAPMLVQKLAESGLDVRRMDVLPTDPAHGQAQQSYSQGGYGGWAGKGQQQSPWQDRSPSSSPRGEEATAEAHESELVSAASINAWI